MSFDGGHDFIKVHSCDAPVTFFVESKFLNLEMQKKTQTSKGTPSSLPDGAKIMENLLILPAEVGPKKLLNFCSEPSQAFLRY